MISSQIEGLGKMALRVVKYAYDHSSQLIGVICFTVSLPAFSLSWTVVVDPRNGRPIKLSIYMLAKDSYVSGFLFFKPVSLSTSFKNKLCMHN